MEQTESSGFKLGFLSPASNTVRSGFPYRHYVKHGTTLLIKQLLLAKLVVVQLVNEVPSLMTVFSTAGPRPGTGPWHHLYRAARGSHGICHFSFLSIFHE